MKQRLEDYWYSTAAVSPVSSAPLGLASLGYRAGVSLRNSLYRTGVFPSRRIEGVRVVSVGNLTVGGAGKTPAVIYLAQKAARAGQNVAVLSRGYGRSGSAPLSFRGSEGLPPPATAGDEPVLIAQRCPSALLFVGANRAAGAVAARSAGADLLLLDDGFQHRSLARDLNILVVDEATGFGNGHLLPRGPLREPLSALERADLIWLRASSGAKASLPTFKQPQVRALYEIGALLAPDHASHGPRALEGRPVIALAAIARPERFVRTLEALGMKVIAQRLFADHHRFSSSELAEVAGTAERLGALVLTTEKDAVRLPQGYSAWVARLEVRIVDGAATLESLLGL